MGLSEIAPPSASVSCVHSCLPRCSEERSSWLASKDSPSDAAAFGPDLPRSGLVPPLPFLPASAVCSAGHLSGLLHPETDHGVRQVSEPLCSALPSHRPSVSRPSRLPWSSSLPRSAGPAGSARPFPGVWSPCGGRLPLGHRRLPFRVALGSAAASTNARVPRGGLSRSLLGRWPRRKHLVHSLWRVTLRSLPLACSRARAVRFCLVRPRSLGICQANLISPLLPTPW